ncbi:MAG TPA: phosphotransferase [Candidatus Hydrogenedentes bacterium]|nr:phosphotransferase [Candidatus Hydrogenedentota bacterium]
MTSKLSGLEVVAEVIRRYYDVGAVQLPQPLEAAHQRRHRKMVVQTDAGRFLVKTYKRDPVVLDALRFQHRLSDHLNANGLPVAVIKRARDGKGIVELDTWAMELQQFIEGGSMPLTAHTLVASARALGEFHRVCRDVPCPPRDAQMWRFSDVPRAAFQELFKKACAETDEQRIVPHCNAIALFLHNAADALSTEKRSTFETGLIHGDWHGGNLMFRGEQLVAIVDLEFAGDGCFLEDIAYGMSNLCLRTTPEHNVLTARSNIMLDHYQFSRSLSYAEMVALYFAVGVKQIATVSYQLVQQGANVAGLTAAQWMEVLASQCEWLNDRAHKARWGET